MSDQGQCCYWCRSLGGSILLCPQANRSVNKKEFYEQMDKVCDKWGVGEIHGGGGGWVGK